jgi:predicted Zn finger-like uncharacterized protein
MECIGAVKQTAGIAAMVPMVSGSLTDCRYADRHATPVVPSMLIVCPNCATGYEVKPAALGTAGRNVRCAHCRKEWFVAATAPPSALTATAPESAAAVAARSTAADEVDWNPPAEPAAAAVDRAGLDDDAAGSWDVPEFPSPPLAPESEPIDVRASAPPRPDVETLAARLKRRVPRKRYDRLDMPLLPTLVVLQLVLIGAGLVWRNDIVRVLPQTASLFRTVGLTVNLRGLAFSDVHLTKDVHDGVTVLVIEGAIKNITGSAISVPRLRFSLRNAGLAELFSWTAPPDRGTLGPNETLPFRSRLASPPADGSDVLVRFITRQDFLNGAH